MNLTHATKDVHSAKELLKLPDWSQLFQAACLSVVLILVKQSICLLICFLDPSHHAITIHAQATYKACFLQFKCLSRMIFISNILQHNFQTSAPVLHL